MTAFQEDTYQYFKTLDKDLRKKGFHITGYGNLCEKSEKEIRKSSMYLAYEDGVRSSLEAERAGQQPLHVADYFIQNNLCDTFTKEVWES